MLENNTNTPERKNPFFEPYNTPHDTVPFNRIKTSDYEEAFMEGIRRDDEAIEKLVNDPETPTFENTIVRVDNENGENYYDLLSRVSTVFSCMLSAETCDELDALAQKMSPILTKHANDVKLNRRLFERIKYVYEHHRELTAEEQMLLDNCYDGFVRSGALLDDEGKERLRNLTEEASLLSLQFSQNLLKENKAFTLHITDEAQLDGLPETAREAAALAAKEAEKEGWLFTLDYPSYSPFMTYSTQRELRRQLYIARNTEGTHDNTENNLEICKRLVNLRREIAQLLGYETYADYVLVHRMASNADNVYKLLNDLIDAYKPTAVEEVKALEREAKQTEGDDFVMARVQSRRRDAAPLLRTVEGYRRRVRLGYASLRHHVQGEHGHSGVPSRREGLRGVRQGRLVSGCVLRRLPSAQGQAGRCMDDRIPGAMD